MALITIPFTFSVGQTIISSQHNSNFSTIYNDYNGNITDANIAAGAGIEYTKLALNNTIKSTDILSSTTIATGNLGSGSALAYTFLQGNSAWGVPTGLYNYTSGTTSSTTPTSIIKIAWGSLTGVGTAGVSVSNLPFSSTSYTVIVSISQASVTGDIVNANITSASAFTVYSSVNTHNVNWIALGT